jgi:tellurite resistance protein TerC
MIEPRPSGEHQNGAPRSLTYAWARRIAIALVGGTVLIAGLAMTVLPGPAIVVIPAGLAILGIEFAWARRWLKTVKAKARAAVDRVNGKRL